MRAEGNAIGDYRSGPCKRPSGVTWSSEQLATGDSQLGGDDTGWARWRTVCRARRAGGGRTRRRARPRSWPGACRGGRRFPHPRSADEVQVFLHLCDMGASGCGFGLVVEPAMYRGRRQGGGDGGGSDLPPSPRLWRTAGRVLSASGRRAPPRSVRSIAEIRDCGWRGGRS